MDTQSLAANLRRIREQRGLSQGQLAEQAGLSRIGLGNLEKGDVEPRVATLHELAAALDVSVHALLAPAPKLQRVRFRSQKKLTSRAQVLVVVAARLKAFNELEQLLNEPVRPKVARFARTSDPVSLAQKVRAHFGLGEKDPVRDICGLLEARGYKVLPVDVASDGFFGLSVAEEEGGPAVVVNISPRISVERRIFSAAHELGHLLMHLDAYDVSRSDENKAEEDEANLFGSYFLMPQAAFESEWNEAYGLSFVRRVLKVKRMFRVSYRTVLYRLQETGVMANPWLRFNVEYRRERGGSLKGPDEPEALRRMSESPAPSALSSEEPEGGSMIEFEEDRLPTLVRRAFEEELITLSRGAEVLGMSLEEMRALAKSWVQ